MQATNTTVLNNQMQTWRAAGVVVVMLWWRYHNIFEYFWNIFRKHQKYVKSSKIIRYPSWNIDISYLMTSLRMQRKQLGLTFCSTRLCIDSRQDECLSSTQLFVKNHYSWNNLLWSIKSITDIIRCSALEHNNIQVDICYVLRFDLMKFHLCLFT